jgi:hypothetical protein
MKSVDRISASQAISVRQRPQIHKRNPVHFSVTGQQSIQLVDFLNLAQTPRHFALDRRLDNDINAPVSEVTDYLIVIPYDLADRDPAENVIDAKH